MKIKFREPLGEATLTADEQTKIVEVAHGSTDRYQLGSTDSYQFVGTNPIAVHLRDLCWPLKSDCEWCRKLAMRVLSRGGRITEDPL